MENLSISTIMTTCFLWCGLLQPSVCQNSDLHLTPCGDEAFEVLTELFNYDSHAPLEVDIVQKEDFGTYIREKIIFTGNRNSRVPGYLALPTKGPKPYPVMILLHAGASRKEHWWAREKSKTFEFERGETLIDSLIDHGYAVVAMDAQYHGERLIENDFITTVAMYFEQQYFHKFKELQLQTVIEYRRLFDYIYSREDLDKDRIGLMGMSMGGVISTILMTLENKIKLAVLCVTPLSLEKNSPILYPLHYAPRIKNDPAILYLVGKDDPLVPKASAQRLFSLIKASRKKMVSLNSGHRPSMEYVSLSINWIKKYL